MLSTALPLIATIFEISSYLISLKVAFLLSIYLTNMDLLELMFSTEKHELRSDIEKLRCLRGTLKV